jgi:Zn-dependent metalloprotease
MVTAVATVAAPMAQASPAAPPPNSPDTVQALAARSAASIVAAHPAYLHASAEDAFVQHDVISGEGAQYVPYARTYQGLPVIGGDFVIVTDDSGHVITHSVAQTRTIDLPSTKPAITAARSLATAKSRLDKVTSATKPELAVDAEGTPRLVWNDKVTGTRNGRPSILSVYVNARTGAVAGTKEHVAFGTGQAAYSGPNPVHFGTTKVGSTYKMIDPNIRNLNCDDYSTHRIFTSSTDRWGNGNAGNEETGCVDALFTADTESTMLHQWLGRDSMDGNGGAWPIRIGLNKVNAFYDGREVNVGHSSSGDWLGSMDVVGHEMGHGVDDHTPGGISGQGTQEFVADTFGADTEWFADEPAPYDTPDFTVGEEVNLTGSGPIRYMYNPSIVNQPNCYSSAIPRDEVHADAGPGDHWYYLLSEGSSPTNGQPSSPTCDGSSVGGIGIENAAKIMYNAMLMKTSASSYLKYRTWTLKAAKTVFPNDCTEFDAVKAAWDAVSVPAQPGDPTCTSNGGLTVNDPGDQQGTVGTAASLQLSASGGKAPLTWTATGLPNGLSVSDSGLVSGTPTKAGTYKVAAKVTGSTGATGSTTFTWVVAPKGGGGGCTGFAPWSATQSYSPNDVVSFNGHKWTSLWYSTGVKPGSPTAWDIWQDDGAC